jgi:hypothetical protein
MTDNSLPPEFEPQIDQFSIERLLTGQPAESSADPAIRAVAALVSAARTAASPAEMSGEAIAVAAYSRAVSSGIATTRRSRTWRSPMLALSTLLASKVAAAAAIGAVSVGGVSAVAYTGNLPTPVQNLAHHAVGAPAAHHGRPAGTPKGPDATGKAAFGLCTAYQAAQANGGAPTNSVAFQNLANAAGGVANIATYCATVPHPGHTPSGHPSGPPASHPAGPPASHPAKPHASHPAGPPTTAPAHQQPSHPASASTTPSAG